MSVSGEYIEEAKKVFYLLQQSIQVSQVRVKSQHKIYSDLNRIFSKNASKLNSLVNTINDQVLAHTPQQDITHQYYLLLNKSLLRLADSSRRASQRFKTQVLDPFKTFNENNEHIFEDIKKKVDDRIQAIVVSDQEHLRMKTLYGQAYQKFDKHRQTQKKIMEKVQNGNKNQLEKFNNTTKKLAQNIAAAENSYVNSVEKANNEWERIRAQFSLYYQSIKNNQTTRLNFLKKSLTNTFKIFEEFTNQTDAGFIKKIDEITNSPKYKSENIQFGEVEFLLDKVIKNNYKQQFESYEDAKKGRKKKLIQQQSHLIQIFGQIKEEDKNSINDLVLQWFPKNKKFSELNPVDKDKNQKIVNRTNQKSIKQIGQKDQCKQKIICEISHSFYFIQILYQKITQMNASYCKVNQEIYLYILNAFSVITNNIDSSADPSIQFIYKMMVISERILLKKQNTRQTQNQRIEILSKKFGKSTLKFKDSKLLSQLLSFLEKRKAKKKNKIEGKGALNIAKGFFAALTRKNTALNEDQAYSCLDQLVKLIANFSIPNEIVLPFIKQSLGSNYQGSYQYLKETILSKKDLQQRQSLFYRKQIKEKKEELFKKAVQNKRMGEYAIWIIAKNGFLGIQQLKFRALSKSLKNIHLQILARLNMPTNIKWIKLIPVDKQLQYVMKKQQVAFESVPSAVEQIITLDVNRSLHLHGQSLNPTVLHSLLRIYAYFHKDISYCQGMNYLAGYIYIKTKNEEYTYRIFQYLMEVRFKQIFINQFQVLKIKMYQFQRLLAIFHPDISQHFKKHSISPQCYIVSWIITLFASSYQYTLESYLIDFLWERFIIWGWPEFFKFVLWLFSIYKEQLVDLTYDRALHFLGEISRSKFFLASKAKLKQQFGTVEDPSIGIQRYPVSQDLLNKFLQEYQLDKK